MTGPGSSPPVLRAPRSEKKERESRHSPKKLPQDTSNTNTSTNTTNNSARPATLVDKMRSRGFAGALGAVAVLATAVASLSVRGGGGGGGGLCSSGFCPRSDALGELGGSLSSEAQILFPDSAEFVARTARWSNLSPPRFTAVVVPGNQEDVAATVRLILPSLC